MMKKASIYCFFLSLLLLVTNMLSGCDTAKQSGVNGAKQTVNDFIEKFEKAGYQLEFGDGSISDIEEDLDVSGMIITYAQYDGEYEERINDAIVSDYIDFRYIKCADEEKATIVYDALVYEMSLEDGYCENNGSKGERTTDDYYYSWQGFNAPGGFRQGREIVSRCGSVVIYMDMCYTDYVKIGAEYHFLGAEILRDLGF